MGINRGKQFEQLVKEQIEKLSNVSIDRLYDITTGYINQSNICDFIIYKKPNILYLECKAIHGNTLNFKSNIRQNQWEGLLAKSTYITGAEAGILVWFIDLDKTLFLDIQYLDLLKSKGNKSFNINKDINVIPTIELSGKKKKVFFEYDMNKFIKDVIA